MAVLEGVGAGFGSNGRSFRCLLAHFVPRACQKIPEVLEKSQVTKEVCGDPEEVETAPGAILKEHEKFPEVVEEIAGPLKEVR